MAIYSLHHRPIGKSTQAAPYTAAAHVRYITRPSAMSRLDAERMPGTPGRAATFMRRGEDVDRKNARVADKLMLALPRELDAVQRAALVRSFAEEVTQGRAPWLAAFHDKGKDLHNPHAHLIIRDRDADGRRVAALSEKGSTERLRQLWEGHANRALEAIGCTERIDRRTLDAQGIHREPTIHEGPQSQEMDKRGAAPTSKVRKVRNGPGAKTPERTIDYRAIDGALSRPTYNREIKDRETPADYWAAIEQHKRHEELELLRAIHHPPLTGDGPTSRDRMRPGEIRHSDRSKERAVDDVDSSDRKRRAAILSEQRTREAESGSLFDNAMNKAYQDPKAAHDKMREYRADHGDQALSKALADPNTQDFGKRPGSLLTRDGYRAGAPERRRDSQIARRSLPELYFEAERDKDLKAGAQQAHDQLHPPQREPADYGVPQPYHDDRSPKNLTSEREPQLGRDPDQEPVPFEPPLISPTRPGKAEKDRHLPEQKAPVPIQENQQGLSARVAGAKTAPHKAPQDEKHRQLLQAQRLASVEPRPLPKGYEALTLPDGLSNERPPVAEPVAKPVENAKPSGRRSPTQARSEENMGRTGVDGRDVSETPTSARIPASSRSNGGEKVPKAIKNQRSAKMDERALPLDIPPASRSTEDDKVRHIIAQQRGAKDRDKARQNTAKPKPNAHTEALPVPARSNDDNKVRNIIARQRAKDERDQARGPERDRGRGD